MSTHQIINASPTKSFFIGMLTRDIELSRSIMDLVDNCVDGANRIRPDGNYQDLCVRISITPEEFKIIDNCGGISLDIAQNYAFRFGRPEGMPETKHSVGQFGVGMKRALFKLGEKFKIESKTEKESFLLEVDVNQWKDFDDWTFTFNDIKTDLNVPELQRGTIILVNNLHENVSQDFSLENFINRLRLDIMLAHQIAIEHGLTIMVNSLSIEVNPLTFLHSEELKPAKFTDRYQMKDGFVDVTIYAGVAEGSPILAGWYVYCNGRMVLEADQTIITGWGEGAGEKIPKYHPHFARFRGFVFFDSDLAALLPWNTTKTGVDTDSPIFRAVRQKMIILMRQVITFLNAVSKETAAIDTDNKPLNDLLVKRAKPATIANVLTSDFFTWPRSAPKPGPRLPMTGRIQYDEPIEKINQVKKVLKVSSYKEVGERTFSYFYDREVAD